jgi:hypothetical protein
MSEQKNVSNFRGSLSSLMFILFSLVGGYCIGLGFGIAGTFFYLIFIFPIVIGLLSGSLITDVAKYTKTRNPSLILITCILTAIVLYGSMFYTRFLGLQVTTSLQAFGGLSDESLKDAKVFVDYALEKETGHSGFVGYVLYKANQGVSIGKVFRSNSLNLGPIFTWVYWLLEFGVITFVMFYRSKGISTKLLCESCNSWYAEKRHIGGIPATKEVDVLNSIKLKDYGNAGQVLEENADVPSTEFYLQSCPVCDKSNSLLSATKVRKLNGKLTFVDILNTTLTPHEKNQFVKEIKSFG